MTTIHDNGGPLQLTNTRKVRDHLRVDIDGDGRVFIEIETDAEHVIFYLDRKALRRLRDDLTFYLNPAKAAATAARE